MSEFDIKTFTNHRDTESTEGTIFFARSGAPLTQRDRPLIGQTGNPPEGWDSKRSAEKRSQPCGHDLVTRWLHVNGWRQAKEIPPEAEALFPGQRPVPLKSGAPGQGKNTLLRDLCASVVNLQSGFIGPL